MKTLSRKGPQLNHPAIVANNKKGGSNLNKSNSKSQSSMMQSDIIHRMENEVKATLKEFGLVKVDTQE